MSFYEFLMNSYKVETIIGMVSFLIAATLGFFAYQNSSKMKKIAEIISLANTKNKAKVATALMEVLPSYELPDLSAEQGFEIIKLNMEKKEREFVAKMGLLKLGVLLFSLVLLVTIVLASVRFSKEKEKGINIESITTTGEKSPAIIGDNPNVTITDIPQEDSIKKNDSLKKKIHKKNDL